MAPRELGRRRTGLFSSFGPATLFVLAALVSPPLTSPASAAGVARCDVWVRFDDRRAETLTVRAAPEDAARPIAVLDPGSDQIHLRVTGAAGLWLRVRSANLASSGVRLLGRTGWIRRADAQVTTAGDAGGRVSAWWGPTTRKGRKGAFPTGSRLGVLACWGTWVFVGDARKAGWLAPRDFCPAGSEACG